MSTDISSLQTIYKWNRRASATLSPVLVHFVAPHGKLYQRLLLLEQMLQRLAKKLSEMLD